MERVLGINISNNLTQIIGPNSPFHFTGSIYFTDFIDILIIAILIYSVFLLFQRTRTFLILIGLIITSILYLFAKFFNLYLTSLALQYFFGVFFIVFAIIFQQEIRRFFEWIGLIGTRRIKVSPFAPKSPSATEIIQACVKMAQSKTGALIVIQGKDTLEEFIEGGTVLDGNISEEILLSIFDPHSEGHDGAVIIGNNRLSRFGTHLPLSNNFKEIGRHGTRHSAALGLTENSDALCIVISEEKGSISISRDGRLKKLDTYQDLEKELDKFIKDKYVNKHVSLTKKIFARDSVIKIGAITSAGIIWFFSAYQTGIVEKTYIIPVNFFKLPENVFIESSSPKNVTISVTGRGNMAFSGINYEDFQLDIDASSVSGGINRFDIASTMIKQPLNLGISSIEPQSVLLTAKKYFNVSVPVKIKTKGEPIRGYQVSKITITPETISLLIPESLKPPTEVLTETIDLTDQNESFVVPVKFILPDGIRPEKIENISANVAITIEKI